MLSSYADSEAGDCIDPRWARNRQGKFFRFVHLDPEAEGLAGTGGVFVVWHGGVQPAWVYVGATSDLAVALHELSGNAEIMDYERRGGLFLTWAAIRGDCRDGIVSYLSRTLRPRVASTAPMAADVVPLPVLLPGGR